MKATIMKEMINRFFGKKMEDRLQEKLRQYIDGEFTPEEHAEFLEEIKTSPELRLKLERLQFLVNSLQTLPKYTPPSRVWESISQEINTTKPDNIWFPWLHANPAFFQLARALPVIAALLLASVLFWNFTDERPNYRVVSIKNINGYAEEANAYMAHHDLSNEPLATRESLIALYTYENEE